jgi:hypothetical protein
MKQTAVEWLNQRRLKNGFNTMEDFQQAKQMERQQKQNYLIEYFAWHKSMGFVSHTPEDIIEFNETHGNESKGAAQTP